MGNFLETIYDVLFHPRQAMRIIASRQDIRLSLAVFLISELLPVWAMILGNNSKTIVPVGYVVILQLFISMLLWFLFSAVFQLISEFMGGKGKAIGLMSALGFAYLPRIFIVPSWVLAAVLPENLRPIIYVIAGIIILMWTIMLAVRAIQGAHDLSASRGIIVFCIPLVVFIALTILGFLIVTSALIQLPSWMGKSF